MYSSTVKFSHWRVSRAWMGSVMQRCYTLHHRSSAFCSNSWSPAVKQYLTIIDTIYSYALLLTVLQSWYMGALKRRQKHFCCWWLHSDWQCQMLLFHTLVFTIWLVVINPHHIPNDYASQEFLTFMRTANQKVLADCETLHLCSSVRCFENHPVKILLKPSLPWMISLAELWLNADDRPLNSHLSVIQKSWYGLIPHLSSSWNIKHCKRLEIRTHNILTFDSLGLMQSVMWSLQEFWWTVVAQSRHRANTAVKNHANKNCILTD
jgi:hypothetical protein